MSSFLTTVDEIVSLDMLYVEGQQEIALAFEEDTTPTPPEPTSEVSEYIIRARRRGRR